MRRRTYDHLIRQREQTAHELGAVRRRAATAEELLVELERRGSLLRALDHAPAAEALRLYELKHSQLGQELVAWAFAGCRRDGYFVDIGASDGVRFSNSLLLERELGWRGILVEPAGCFHGALRANRSTATIDTRAVSSRSGTTTFLEMPHPTLSTIEADADVDHHVSKRRTGSRYPVETVSLDDLLDAHRAPTHIDYLSLDTAGSELDILAAHDFNTRTIGVITCEHNFTLSRTAIMALLTDHGYERVLERHSSFDDWYVLRGDR